MAKKIEQVTHQLPSLFKEVLTRQLNTNGPTSDGYRLAQAVQKMSDYYIAHPKSSTPWSEAWAQLAQSVYYLPLNGMRNCAVFQEAQRLGFTNDLTHFIDFGAGLGAATWAALGTLENFSSWSSVTWVDQTLENESWFLDFKSQYSGTANWTTKMNSDDIVAKKTLAVFSYSLTELKELPSWAFDCEALMIVEPSTQEDGRRLQVLRSQLLQKGFSVWGPCLHELECPLLKHSNRDWCHHRIHWQPPPWLIEIEKHLPWKNPSLTYSYLLVRKTPPPWKGKTNEFSGRVLGDTLYEKGKTRQMICATDERKFLAWLNKQGEAPHIPQGSIVRWDPLTEVKSNEIRPTQIEIISKPL